MYVDDLRICSTVGILQTPGVRARVCVNEDYRVRRKTERYRPFQEFDSGFEVSTLDFLCTVLHF